MSRTSFVLVLAIIVAQLTTAGSAACQTPPKITPEWIFSDSADAISAVPSFQWLDNSSLLLYDKRTEKSKRTFEIFNPTTGRRRPILDMPGALKSRTSLLEKDDSLKVLPWPDACDLQGKRAVYICEDDIFLLEFASATFARITKTKAVEKCVTFSPDGRMLAFVRDNDLYAYDIAAGTERRLTTAGSDTLINGDLSWVYYEEIFDRSDVGYWWSGDSRTIAFLRTNQARVDSIPFLSFENYHPRPTRQFYPFPGDSNPTVSLGIVNAEDAKTVWADLSSAPYEYIVDVTWIPGNSSLSVETLNRPQTTVNLFAVDRVTGSSRLLLNETDTTWVDYARPCFFADSKHFLWLSQRDGFAHLYNCDADKSPQRQITRGQWADMPTLSISRSGQSLPFALDESQKCVYFMSTAKSPFERHLYRASLDGRSVRQLTPEDGSHHITFSPDLRYYVDEHSSLNSLPALSLHFSDGSLIADLAPPRPELIAPLALQYPTIMSYRTPDNLTLPCMLTVPATFDSTKKYPVVLEVYGGPSAPIVNNSWQGKSTYSNQLLVDLGYVVASFDNRSSAVTPKSESRKIKGDLWGDVELNDLIAFVDWLKSKPYVDSQRLGIIGWSGGGTYTLLAMTRTKLFQAGIAGAPVTDWRYYDTKYTENYMGQLSSNTQGYQRTSLVDRVGDLHGKLLLMHGLMDDNVNVQNTWAFVDKLIDQGTLFEMLIYTSAKHDVAHDKDRAHRLKSQLDFWSRNL